MGFRKIAIETYLEEFANVPVLDVRTPAEYEDGHIPGAVNLPLFSNEERAKVGTLYKQAGPDAAIMKGLEFVGPKMKELAKSGRKSAVDGKIAVHCWRGGKRSESMAWLLGFTGLDVLVIDGGYKAYRRYNRETFEAKGLHVCVLGGRTGSNKTPILHAMREAGEQVIDLEGLANHKGSAFGAIGEQPQPSNEQFENAFAKALRGIDPSKRVWVENESKAIGRVYVPDGFWSVMKNSPLIHLEVPLEKRVENLVKIYADNAPVEELRESFDKIYKRLGGQHHKAATEALEVYDYHAAAAIALKYYDKTYDYNLEVNTSPSIRTLNIGHSTPEEAAPIIIEFANDMVSEQAGVS